MNRKHCCQRSPRHRRRVFVTVYNRTMSSPTKEATYFTFLLTKYCAPCLVHNSSVELEVYFNISACTFYQTAETHSNALSLRNRTNSKRKRFFSSFAHKKYVFFIFCKYLHRNTAIAYKTTRWNRSIFQNQNSSPSPYVWRPIFIVIVRIWRWPNAKLYCARTRQNKISLSVTCVQIITKKRRAFSH